MPLQMETKSKTPYFSIFAVFCATWFALTGWIWPYLANIIFSFPFGVIGLFLWWKGKKSGESRALNKTAGVILVVGVVIAFGSLAILTLGGG
jgi:hypothetical protein